MAGSGVLLVAVSYDFAVIPVESFTTADEALRICDPLYDDPGGSPPPALAELLDDLERGDAMGDDGFLSVRPVDAGSVGAVLCTRRYNDLTYAMLELTKDRGLAVVDVQTRQLFDPRGRVEVQVTLGGGAELPYLTTSILTDLLARPHHTEPWLVVARGEQHYVQAFFPLAADCVLEYRDGGPDYHYQAIIADRSVVAHALWDWTTRGPDQTEGIEWTHIAADQFEA